MQNIQEVFMQNNIAQDFNSRSLIRFALPSMIMMVFMSIYQMTDAVFVSRLIGSDALSALNITYPLPSIIIAVSVMLATGGSAIIAKNMGEGKNKEAKENFSALVCTGLIFGIIVTVLGLTFIKPIIYLLGSPQSLYQYCYEYLFVFIAGTPLAVIQMLFQTFFVTAGKPTIGLMLTVIGGISNIFFDYLFIGLLDFNIAGAAMGTILGYSIPAVFGIFYFFINRNGTLYFIKPKFHSGFLKNACLNGSSEMVNNLSVAVTTYIFNIIMLKLIGSDGVAAITIILYAQFLMTSIFMGFSGGVAPIFSYKYGEKNYSHIKNIFKICIRFILITSVVVLILSFLTKDFIIMIFTPKTSPVFAITQHGFVLFCISFLFAGINIFASSMFTAFSNGKVSAIISLLRTFVFLILSLVTLPFVIGVDGVWIAVPIAEFLSLLVSVRYFYSLKNTYHYL